MMYLFENPDCGASIVYDESTLNERDKELGIAVERLPDIIEQVGKIAVLKCKKATNEVWYEYVDIPKDPVEDRVKLVEQALLEMMGV